ncbi:MAG: DUF2142 domain-containing protein [Thermomicrobiales bacterium]
MKRPSPIILITLLLVAAIKLVEQPTTRVVLIGVLILAIGVALGRPLVGWTPARHLAARLHLRSLAWLAPFLITLLAFGAMSVTWPHLRTTYTPDQFTTASDIDSQRGFYPTEVDGAGNHYVWTQDHATLVFNFLIHKPVTLTFFMRSAAIAGGPDVPVRVLVNGEDVGELRPDPKNAAFQPLSLRLVPHDWGGQQTEIKLLPAPFKPETDSRTLGTMIQRISVDKSETWSSVGRRMWLLWAFPLLAALTSGAVWATRRYQSPWAAYGTIALCLLGTGCAAAITGIMLRIGFIERNTYVVWLLGGTIVALCFLAVATVVPIGAAGGATVAQRMRAQITVHDLPARVRALRRQGTRSPETEEMSPTRRVILRDLVIVFLIALGVRLIWTVLIPPWQAPDEPEHYTYISHIVEQGAIPHPPYPSYPGESDEFTKSAVLTLFPQLSAAVANRVVPELPYAPIFYNYEAARQYTAPHAERLTAAAGRATDYPPLYYLAEALPYRLFQSRPIVARLFAVRCGSAVLGALSCLFAYLIGYDVRRTRRWGWALGLSMALMPMYVFITATTNNDVAMDLGATALIWLLVRLYRMEAVTDRFALIVGVVSGLALLTKPGPLPVVIAVGMFLFFKLFPLLSRSRRFSLDNLRTFGLYAVGGIAAYGPWVLVRYHYFGDFSPGVGSLVRLLRPLTGLTDAAASAPANAGVANHLASISLASTQYSLFDYFSLERQRGGSYFYWLLIKSFWGNFGWLDAPMPDRAFALIAAFCFIGLIGLALQIVLQANRRAVLLLLSGVVLIQATFLFVGVDYYYGVARTGEATGLQGRYFFPILAPLLLLLLSGWECLFRDHPFVLRAAPLGMIGLQLIAIATLMSRYYGVEIG